MRFELTVSAAPSFLAASNLFVAVSVLVAGTSRPGAYLPHPPSEEPAAVAALPEPPTEPLGRFTIFTHLCHHLRQLFHRGLVFQVGRVHFCSLQLASRADILPLRRSISVLNLVTCAPTPSTCPDSCSIYVNLCPCCTPCPWIMSSSGMHCLTTPFQLVHPFLSPSHAICLRQ